MKYFIDTHDKTKGSFPKEELTEQQFFDNFDALDKAAGFGAFGHAALLEALLSFGAFSKEDGNRFSGPRSLSQLPPST
jgi:hypothetical protein